ncbi:MAG: hypothetical protein WDN10_02060 [bacterium]
MGELPFYTAFRDGTANMFEQIRTAMAAGEWLYLALYFLLVCFVVGSAIAVLVAGLRAAFPDWGWWKKLIIEWSFFDLNEIDSNLTNRLSVRNVGMVPVGVRTYGYKTWDGDVYEKEDRPIVHGHLLQPEYPAEIFPFHDGTGHVPVRKEKVYYYFVKTGNKTFRAYPFFRPLAWGKRLVIYLSCMSID